MKTNRRNWDVSDVGKAFGVNARDCSEGCKLFIKTVIPSSWEPEMIFGGLWEEHDTGNYGYMSHVVKLSKFPYSFQFGAKKKNLEEADTFHLKISKQIRNILWDWIFKTKGIEYPAPSSHGIWAGTGQWFLNYRIEKFDGTFQVWIVPTGKRMAMLIACLTEARILGVTSRCPGKLRGVT
jgi:hypothetical protein